MKGDEHADLPEHLCGGDESGCGGIIRRIMGNNRHGNRQIGTGCEARDNQADKQRGEISGKDADDRADSVDQINPVEEQHAANLVCEAASRTGSRRQWRKSGCRKAVQPAWCQRPKRPATR